MRIIKLGCIILLLPLISIGILPYLYTPPALSEQKIQVYEKVVTFVKKHKIGEKNIVLSYPVIEWNGYSYYVFMDKEVKKLQPLFSLNDIQQIKALTPILSDVYCDHVEIESNMIMFYSRWRFILPPPAGVLYSLKGTNPNVVGGPIVAKMRPYYRITGKWYASRKLIYRFRRGFHFGSVEPIPKSLVDLTLSTHWLDNK